MNQIRPGWQTTEFWLTLAKAALTVLVVLGIVASADAPNLEAAAVRIVVAVATIVSSTLVLSQYIKDRAAIKVNEQDNQALPGPLPSAPSEDNPNVLVDENEA